MKKAHVDLVALAILAGFYFAVMTLTKPEIPPANANTSDSPVIEAGISAP